MLFNNQIRKKILFGRIFLAFFVLFFLLSCDGDVNEELDTILFYEPQDLDDIDKIEEGSILFTEGFESGWGNWENAQYGAQAPFGEWGITDAYQRSGNHSAFVVTGDNSYSSSRIQKEIQTSEINDLGVSFFYQIHCDDGFRDSEFIFSVGSSLYISSHKVLFWGGLISEQSSNTWTEVSKLVDKDVINAGKIYIGFSSGTARSHCYYYLDDLKVFYVNQ